MEKEIIKISENLVSLKAMSPDNGGTGEIEKMEYIKKYMSEFGGVMKEYPIEDKRIKEGYRPNVSFTLEGEDTSKTIWIISHIDVVPEGDISLWKSDPFKLKVENGKIIGRGVSDNHNAIVPSMILYKLISESGIKPPCNYGVFFFADEENGSEYGIGGVIKKYKDAFRKNDLVYVPDMPTEEGNVLEIAEKSIFWLKIKIKGIQTHGSRPDEGVNTHKASAYFITEVEKEAKEKFTAKNELYDYPYSSFEPTMGSNNVTNINTIPGEQNISYDCRILPCYKLEDVFAMFHRVKEKIEKDFNVKIEYQTSQFNQAVEEIKKSSLAYVLIEKAIKNVLGKDSVAIGVGGGTCGYFLRAIGIDAIVCGIGEARAHQPNEYISIGNIIKGTKLYAEILCEYKKIKEVY